MSLDRQRRCQAALDRVMNAINAADIRDPNTAILHRIALNWATVFAFKHRLERSCHHWTGVTPQIGDDALVRAITGDRP